MGIADPSYFSGQLQQLQMERFYEAQARAKYEQEKRAAMSSSDYGYFNPYPSWSYSSSGTATGIMGTIQSGSEESQFGLFSGYRTHPARTIERLRKEISDWCENVLVKE